MIIDIIPCVLVTSLDTDAFMSIVAYVDKLMVRATSARGRKESSQGAVATLRRKKKRLRLPPEETSRQTDCDSKAAREFGENFCKLKPKTTTFYSPVKQPETQKCVCLLCIRELQCTMLSKEISAQIQWIL